MDHTPPIGIAPRWLAEEERIRDLLAAMTRYNAASLQIPAAWLVELADLNTRVQFKHSGAREEPDGIRNESSETPGTPA